MRVKFITKGVTRFVILVGKYAIKVPKPIVWNHLLRGFLSNMEEQLIWKIACLPNNVLTDTKDHLCPVIWSSWGGWILVMRRVQPVDPKTWKPIEILYKVCGDHKPDNYGMLDDRLWRNRITRIWNLINVWKSHLSFLNLFSLWQQEAQFKKRTTTI